MPLLQTIIVGAYSRGKGDPKECDLISCMDSWLRGWIIGIIGTV